MIVDSCLAVFSPKIRKTNYSSARNTHALHTCIPRACRSLPDISDDFEYTHTPMHACVCVCVPWFGLSVWVGSNITSVIHTHIHKLKQTKYTRSCTHCATFAIQHSVSQEYTHMHTKTTTHTHTIFPLLENRTFPASGREKCLDKLKTHTRTHNGTFSTHNVDIIFLSRALLSTSWPSEAAFLH